MKQLMEPHPPLQAKTLLTPEVFCFRSHAAGNNGMGEAAVLIKNAVEKALAAKKVTVDLASQISGAEQVGCKAFGEIILANL